MSETGDVSTWRCEVIERAINVETLACAVISEHYFKRGYLPFMLEVLYDEYFSFALKRRVLEKIVDHPDLAARIQDLNRLGTIRNYFAHCGQELTVFATGETYVPDPRKPDKPIDFAALFNEFMDVVPRIETWLMEVYRAKGGQLLDGPPGPA